MGEKKIYLVGVGPGAETLLTGEARAAIAASPGLIGAERLLSAVDNISGGKNRYALTGAEEIIRLIEASPHGEFTVLFSGDCGFYSGAGKLIPLIKKRGWSFRVLNGISSLVYFTGLLGLPWEDVQVVSLHGREGNIIGPVLYHGKTFFLTGGETTAGGTTAARLCEVLTRGGLGKLTVHVGEKLSYPDERLRSGPAEHLAALRFDPLSVALVENPGPLPLSRGNYTLGDDEFIRAAVPMTREEVRAVSLAKLRLENDSVAYDIGAGTGSVSCEMALRARYGRVYAVEHNPDALTLVEQNREKLGLWNITVVPGTAPEALEGLPPADRVFIGGSSGRLEPILAGVLEKNPRCRVVINAITLETLSAATALMKKHALPNTDVVEITLSKAAERGGYHLMRALDPVYIISGGG
ncbi:MAG: precorrin-6Y C5,15-methyltransferase (decarboxylating) subunit CbiT [Spirochaetaceae bacterium]|jgi:precorrin-6Y C5,15-methyltransferase (decarboxylating)|nr:precorrin-6Y C5,15-methyltransferase (decarboxylating) subunit CbiT [Spirochaetaceae bacterium]